VPDVGHEELDGEVLGWNVVDRVAGMAEVAMMRVKGRAKAKASVRGPHYPLHDCYFRASPAGMTHPHR
jgi:hypothetical protein